MVKLRDPHRCRHCGEPGKVIDTRVENGYRKRRRECPSCVVERLDGITKPYRWNSFETIIDPRDIDYKVRGTVN